MSHNKQQTALSFFLMGLIDLEIGKGIATDKVKELHDLFEQAKEMEKQQIMNSYWDGGIDIPNSLDCCQKYINKTYGGNK
jgi:hypothetical protein